MILQIIIVIVQFGQNKNHKSLQNTSQFYSVFISLIEALRLCCINLRQPHSPFFSIERSQRKSIITMTADVSITKQSVRDNQSGSDRNLYFD